jgi:uracil phosphoribosyltransferase
LPSEAVYGIFLLLNLNIFIWSQPLMPVQLKPNNNLHIASHALLNHKLTLLRDKNTNSYNFRKLTYEITILLGLEATRDLKTTPTDVITPMNETYSGNTITKSPVIIPILRAGIPMAEAMLAIMPDAKVGHIGLARDEETHQPSCYYFKVPHDTYERPVFVCDPMLATGGSVIKAVSLLKEKDIQDIRLMCIVTAPEGINAFSAAHPDIPIYAASIDRELNDNAYILPGLGDAGDRVCGT